MGAYQAWAERRVEVARSLIGDVPENSYSDSAVILCSAISGLSSVLWRRDKHNDKKRFVEAIIRFGVDGPDATRVSAPLLAADFSEVRHRVVTTEKSLYLTGRSDIGEAEAVSVCKEAGIDDATKVVRRYSYANLLYKHVRCGFIHEYQPGKLAASDDMLRKPGGVPLDEISYANKREFRAGDWVSSRLIHFPLEWICLVLQALAAGVDREHLSSGWSTYEGCNLPPPTRWWLDGG